LRWIKNEAPGVNRGFVLYLLAAGGGGGTGGGGGGAM
jgi:hypothetical protein